MIDRRVQVVQRWCKGQRRVGLSNWFETFCKALRVKDTASISQRYAAITRRLNTDFWTTTSTTAHSLYVGSYGRNTAIQGFSDLDMLFQLPYATYVKYNSHIGNGQSALLQAVRTSIRKTYPHTGIGADGQVVTVPFTDGLTFEVLPAFVNKNGSYTYPDSNSGGSWKTTDPKAEMSAFRARNTACGGNLVLLGRMMRAWRNKWSVPIGGMLIDTLAYQFMADYAYRNKSFIYFDWLSRDFFKWMADQDADKTYWRAPGSGQYIYGKGLFQYKAKRCYNIAMTAIGHENAEPTREWSAKKSWREIFGTAFPN